MHQQGRSENMQIPFASREEFENKARQLAGELGVDAGDGASLMARMAGYDDAAQVRVGMVAGRQLFSREELIARLQSERPDIANDRAARIVDGLALPTRDARLEDIPQSPDAAPNIGA
jgi:hypothetical protein